MKKLWISIGIIFVIVLGIVLGIAIIFTRVTQEVHEIGAIIPLTGDYANLGQSCRKGIDLAIKQINEESSIHGRKKLKVIYEDSKGKPADAVTAVNKLISVCRQHK